jgi:integrase
MHFPKPFYRKSRKLWYVQIQGHQHNLGPDREKAFTAYHEMMARPEKQVVASESVVALIDRFLDFVQKHRAPETYEWYRSRLQLFATHYPDLTTDALRPIHVQEWIDSFSDAGSGTKRNYARSIQRCLNWGEEMGIVDRSPITRFKKPKGGKRETVISESEWQAVLTSVSDKEFRDLLIVSWETGCRPQESLRVEARHVDLVNSRWVFPESESKTDAPRTVYLTEKALAITKRAMLRYPQGKLFRNSSGEPWTTDAVNCALIRVQIRRGQRQMAALQIEISEDEIKRFAATLRKTRTVKAREVAKSEKELLIEARRKLRFRKACSFAPKYCLYTIRHTWMNRLLTNGVDALTVAVLAGHCDPSTLAKTYQHLSQNPSFLLSQARKTAG